MAKDDDLLPKKKPAATAKGGAAPSKGSSPSPQMLRLMRGVRAVGIFLGGSVTLVGFMALVGLVSDNFWARFIVALVVVIGVPAFVAERLLKRTKLGGGLGMVGDVFAIVLLAIAMGLVAIDFASKPLFVREGDRYARSGSRTMARMAYFLGGANPTFPDEKGPAPAGSGSASASAGSGTGTASAPAPSGAKP